MVASGLPCKTIRKKKMLPYVLHQWSFELFHNFKYTFEVVKLKYKLKKITGRCFNQNVKIFISYRIKLHQLSHFMCS